MGLLTCQHSRIGGAGYGPAISGGEMKRLAFAAEASYLMIFFIYLFNFCNLFKFF
jgi:hypothetical protein